MHITLECPEHYLDTFDVKFGKDHTITSMMMVRGSQATLWENTPVCIASLKAGQKPFIQVKGAWRQLNYRILHVSKR
jgi:hypothetical protein